MVFLLFGATKKEHVVGFYNMVCGNCGATCVHTAVLEKRAFTFFFIPVIPLGSSKKLTCNRCAFTQSSWEMVKHPYAIPVGATAPPNPPKQTESPPTPKQVSIEIPPYPPAPPSRTRKAVPNAPPGPGNCPSCGAPLASGDGFCGGCGREVGE
jgi:hypothetical protein